MPRRIPVCGCMLSVHTLYLSVWCLVMYSIRVQSSDHHQGSITVLVQLLLIGVHASSYSGMWLYVVCASVHTLYLSVWCLIMYSIRVQSSDRHQRSITVLVQLLLIGVHASSYSSMWLYVVCAYAVPVRVVSGYVLHKST